MLKAEYTVKKLSLAKKDFSNAHEHTANGHFNITPQADKGYIVASLVQSNVHVMFCIPLLLSLVIF